MNLVTVNDSFKSHNTTSTKRTKKNAGIERSKNKNKTRTNEQQTDEQTDAKRKKEKKKKEKREATCWKKRRRKKGRKKKKTKKISKYIPHSYNSTSLSINLIIIVKD